MTTPVDRARLDQVSVARLGMASAAIVLSMPSAMVFAAVIAPSLVGLVTVTAVWLAAVGLAIAVRRGRVPAHRAPLLQAVIWLLVVGAVLTGVVLYRAPSLYGIVALMVVSFGVMELDRRIVAGAFALAVAGSLATAAIAGIVPSPVYALVFAAAVAIGGLVHHSSRVFVLEAEHARVEADAQRRLAEVRSAELATALAEAEREIAERQQAEAERERLRDQFVAAQKMEAVGTLAGGLAHDVNNVLAGILTLAELMREEPTGDHRDDLDQIIASCHRGAALTRNLLTFSRRRGHRQQATTMGAVIRAVGPLLTRTLPKRIHLVTEVEVDAPIEADADQLSQATLNLCINAVDAIRGDGTITVVAGARDVAGDTARTLGVAPGRYATLRVTDTGCGMDAVTRARMFEPFFTSKPLGKGTGLGLAMVYGTIEQHRGGIDVVSAPGAGTTVTLLVPTTEAATAAVDAPAPAAVADAASVLVVDDEPMLRTMLRRILERAGHQVEVADGGAEALARYRARRAAVVVMDMAMPGMSGAECFRLLRELDPAARVLLMSGNADDRELAACLAGGAVGFLAKPCERRRLLAAVAAAAGGGPVAAVDA